MPSPAEREADGKGAREKTHESARKSRGDEGREAARIDAAACHTGGRPLKFCLSVFSTLSALRRLAAFPASGPGARRRRFALSALSAQRPVETRQTTQNDLSSMTTQPTDVPAIQLRGVSKSFRTPDGQEVGVQPTDLDVAAGEIHGIIGFSGAGKSTLLRLANLLERPDAGRVIVHGDDLTAMPPATLRAARQRIGMIFQHFNLLHNRTVADNVAFPLRIAGASPERIRERVDTCLAFVGLAEKAGAYPAQLSGGQKQRVAIARALAPEPHVLLADEPTSALDPRTTQSLLEVLADVNRRLGVTILLVSHEMGVIRRLCHRVSVMEGGHIVERLRIDQGRIPPGSQLAQWLKDYGDGTGDAPEEEVDPTASLLREASHV